MSANDGFDINSADLRSTATPILHCSTDVSDALAIFKSQIDGLGSFWGNDEYGEQFAQSYTPGQEAIKHATEQISQVLAAVSRGLTHMASSYEETDQDVASSISGIGAS